MKYIFVVGYMHSGTTLLLNILSKNKNVYGTLGETKFYQQLDLIKSRFPLNSPESIKQYVYFCYKKLQAGYSLLKSSQGQVLDGIVIDPEVLSQCMTKTEHRAIFRIIVDHLASLQRKSHFLEKTPTHIFNIDEIVEDIPDVRFVEIVRDVRDVMASKKTRRTTVWTDRYKPEQQPYKHLEKAYDPIWDTLSWKSAINAGRAATKKYPGQIYTIRYEDLVNNPENMMISICDYLELEFSQEMLQIKSRNAADPKLNQAGITSSSVGRWQTVLNDVEVFTIHLLSKKELTLLSYDLRQNQSFKNYTGFIGIVIGSVVDFFVRLYRRYKMGGWIFVRNIITGYVKRFKALFQV